MRIATPTTEGPLSRYRFSVSQYERMIEEGILDEGDRVELIKGELVSMAPIGIRHASCVARLTKLLEKRAGDDAVVWVQNPIRLAGNSEPEPDVALLKPRADFYGQARPGAEDVLLLIEVADTSLETDRKVKIPLYAESGISEVWLVNLHDDVVEVHTSLSEGNYTNVRRFRGADTLSLPGQLGTVPVADILG